VGTHKPGNGNQDDKVHRDGDIRQHPVVLVLFQLGHDFLRGVVLVTAERPIQEGNYQVGESQGNTQGPFAAGLEINKNPHHWEDGHQYRRQPEIALLVGVANQSLLGVVQCVSGHGSDPPDYMQHRIVLAAAFLYFT
jgi:hypothetical protein